MASTTAAAASMLLSGSSTSIPPPNSTINTASTNINGLNFYLSDNNSRSKPPYHHLPNSSISSTPPFPTITLDLTSTSTSSSSNRVSTFNPRYSSANLNFSSLESNSLPISWNNNSVLNYGNGNGNSHFNKNPVNSFTFGGQNQENLYQNLYQLPYFQKNVLESTLQSLPADTVAAATKAITLDPSFQSALAAALSSIIGSPAQNDANFGNQVIADNNIKNGQKLKLGEPFPVLSSFPSTSNANKCAQNFLNNKTASSTTNSQPGSMFSVQPSLPIPSSKSKPASSGENRDHIL